MFPAVVSVALVLFGTWFFIHGQTIMSFQLRDRLQTYAAIAALQINADDLSTIIDTEDARSPAFRRVVEQLRSIRDASPHLRFAYIMRRTEDPKLVKFVADADALSSPSELDWNHNNSVDDDEVPGMPGDVYDVAAMPALQDEAFKYPTSDPEITVDQWGSLISGYAPIRDSAGETIAVVGLDMVADDFIMLSQSIFSPVAFFAFLFGCLLLLLYGVSYVHTRRMEMLRRLDEERSGVLKLAFHQLGSPLTILQWSLETLEDEEQHPSPAVAEHVERARGATDRINAILEQLKEADRVHERALVYDPKQVSLKSIFDLVQKNAAAEMQKHNQKLVVSCSSDLQLTLDPTLIGGVVRELVDNARNFSADGTTITIVAERMGDHVAVTVSDTGIGIPEADLPRIFEEFTRGSNAVTMQPQGNGLGLYIARGVVEHAGGHISLKSTLGQGTTVTFTLPL